MAFFAQFAAVHVLEPDGLADPQRLAVQLEDALAAIVFDHVVVPDGDHALAYLVARDPAAFLTALVPPVPADQRPCLRLYSDVPHVRMDRTLVAMVNRAGPDAHHPCRATSGASVTSSRRSAA
jgi:hypothetical protein